MAVEVVRSVSQGMRGQSSYDVRQATNQYPPPRAAPPYRAPPHLPPVSHSSYNIFNEAMTAAVAIMDTNFSVAFKGTEAYRQLEANVKTEAEELERLKQVRLLPHATCPPPPLPALPCQGGGGEGRFGARVFEGSFLSHDVSDHMEAMPHILGRPI